MKTLRNRSCLVACLLLCGCSPLMQGSLDTFKAAVQGPVPLELTAADVAAVPYAQILVTTPSSEGVMAKLRQQGDLQYWVASGKQVLLMRNGLVVRTTGLQPALDGTRFDGQSPFKRGLHLVADGERSTRWIDMYQGEQVGLTVNSRFVRKGLETVTILDKPYVLQRIDEKIEIPALGFSGTNHFWVRPTDGVILQSEQHVTPGLELRIVHLRPDWEAAQ
ncbi:YjbF family lipoprotein [Pseudomonas fragi]|uniref:YjbF family lipoprotein n=1 Tax=Pseudomonas fragi TaxID=296 RepID=UPI00147406E3|nr:YjbF family lipoprotein [Pseudomonas fragi]NNB04927.1 YjbF family lipoprotein [Pseudomonas fragi]